MENSVRLNKFIASNGISSRRKVDEFIEQGRVTVNGNTIKELGFKIDPDNDKISLDGELIRTDTKKIYIILNKPKGVITSVSDEKHRATVIDLIKINQKIFPVGRLDYNTSGLLLLTNDGELANKLMSPKSKVYKTYSVQLSRPLEEKHRIKLSEGIKLEGVMTAPAIIKFPKKTDYQSLYISIYEGKNRQVRNMFEHYGYFVRELERTEYAGLKLGSLREGEWSYLTAVELAALNTLVKDTKSSYPRPEHTGKKPFRKVNEKYTSPYNRDDKKDFKKFDKREGTSEKELSYNKSRIEARGVELGFRKNQDPELKRDPEANYSEGNKDFKKFGGKYDKKDSKPGFKKFDKRNDRKDLKPAYKKFDKGDDRTDSKPGFKKFDRKSDKKDSKPAFKKFDKRDDRNDSKPLYKKFDKGDDRKDSKPGFKKFDRKSDKKDSKPGFKKFGKSDDKMNGKPGFKKFGSTADKKEGFKKFGNKNGKRNFKKPGR